MSYQKATPDLGPTGQVAALLRAHDGARYGPDPSKRFHAARARRIAAVITGQLGDESRYEDALRNWQAEGSELPAYVFVYGTLKRGYGNNGLLAGARFMGEAVVDGYALTGSGIPFAGPADGWSVEGEVWRVEDAATAFDLDRLEGFPHLYDRDPVIALLDDGTSMVCWIYVSTRSSLAAVSEENLYSRWEGGSYAAHR